MVSACPGVRVDPATAKLLGAGVRVKVEPAAVMTGAAAFGGMVMVEEPTTMLPELGARLTGVLLMVIALPGCSVVEPITTPPAKGVIPLPATVRVGSEEPCA